jgi:hypothetical protein
VKQDKKLKLQINGKFNDISSADENKNVTVEPLFENYERIIHLFIDGRLKSCTCF